MKVILSHRVLVSQMSLTKKSECLSDNMKVTWTNKEWVVLFIYLKKKNQKHFN